MRRVSLSVREFGFPEVGSAAALTCGFPEEPVTRELDSYMTVVYDPHYQSSRDVHVHVVPWSEFPIVPSCPHYPHGAVGGGGRKGGGGTFVDGNHFFEVWSGEAVEVTMDVRNLHVQGLGLGLSLGPRHGHFTRALVACAVALGLIPRCNPQNCVVP